MCDVATKSDICRLQQQIHELEHEFHLLEKDVGLRLLKHGIEFRDFKESYEEDKSRFKESYEKDEARQVPDLYPLR